MNRVSSSFLEVEYNVLVRVVNIYDGFNRAFMTINHIISF
jgi:hypothetical protein